MQLDAVSARITAAAHSLDRELALVAGQIVIDDPRLRGWTVAANGNIAQPSAPGNPSATLATGGSLTVGAAYTYAICAVSGNTQSVAAVVSITPTSGNQTVNLSWLAVSGATSYNIYRVANSTNFAGYAYLANTTLTSYTDNGSVTLAAGVPPMPIPYDFDVGLDTGTSTIWRIRTLSNNTLEVVNAAVADSLTWSGNLISQACIAGYGASIVVNSSSSVDIFYCVTASGGGTTIQTQHWNGSAWGGAVNLVNLNTQPAQSVVRLSAPNSNTLFYTDSSSNNGTVVGVVVNSGGWKTGTTWDLGPQNLGLTNGGVAVPAQGNVFATLSVIPVGSDYLMAFYANQPLGLADQGIWTMLVSNVGASGSATTAFWRQVRDIYSSNATAAQLANSPFAGRQLFLMFPRLQIIGGNYFMTLIQASQFAGNAIQQLHYMMSSDGKHWTDRQPLAGTDYTSATYLFSDLLYAKMLVSGNRTFFFCYDKAFRTQSTSLVGVSNPAMSVDASADISDWTYTRSAVGQSSTATTQIFNANGKYNGSSIIRRGARLVRRVGYVTTNGAELLTYMTEIISRIEQTTQMTVNGIQNIIKITTRDYIKKLQDWTSDTFVEFNSGKRIHIGTTSFPSNGTTPTTTGGFADTTPVAVWNGTFFVGGGELHPGIIDTNSQYNDNLAVINSGVRGVDNWLEVRLKCINSWTGVYFGFAFQITDYKNYYAVLFNNKGDNKFNVVQATANALPLAPGAKINSYTNVPGFTSPAAVNLTPDQYYWFRFEQHHNTISVFYSADAASGSTARQNWSMAFTFTGVPANISLVGLIAKGNLTISQPIGQTQQITGFNSDSYYADLNDSNVFNPQGQGGRIDYAVRIQAPTNGILRSISVALARFTVGEVQMPPDIVVAFVNDNGSGTKPADLSVQSNILFQTTIGPNSIPIWQNSTPLTNVTVTSVVQVNAGQYYWIWVHPVAAQSAQAYASTQVVNVAWYPGGASSYPTLIEYYGHGGQSNANWLTFSPTGDSESLVAAAYISLNTNGIVFNSYNFASGEMPQTTESVAAEICARSGVIRTTFDSVITDSFSVFDNGADGTANNWFSGIAGTWSVANNLLSGYASTGAYGFVRSNSSRGLIDDTIIDCDFTLLASTVRAGFLMRFSGNPSSPSSTSGYYIEFQPRVTVPGGTVDMINLYEIVTGTPQLLYASPVPFALPIGVSFRVTIVNKSGFYRVYVWDTLAAQFHDNTIVNQGYVGFGCYSNLSGGAVARWTNFRIPDIQETQEYFAIQKNEKGENALKRLFGGNTNRIKYFARFDGSIYISQFNSRTVQDTYQSTMIQGNYTDSDDYWFSDLEAAGQTLYSRRFSPDLLDSDGRRYRQDQINAYTDVEGYNLEAPDIRYGEELSVQYKFDSAAVPAAELEDVITIVNPVDGTNKNFIINDVALTYKPASLNKSSQFKQTVGCRQFVS